MGGCVGARAARAAFDVDGICVAGGRFNNIQGYIPAGDYIDRAGRIARLTGYVPNAMAMIAAGLAFYICYI